MTKSKETTLRAELVAAHIKALTASNASNAAPDGMPTADALRRAVKKALGRELEPWREALLLRATMARFDPHAAALAAPAAEVPAQAGAFTVEQLDALPPGLWRAAVAWLLAREGYTVDEVARTETSATWRGRSGEQDAVAHAIRLPDGQPLDADAVRHAAALAASTPNAATVMIATAPATLGALQAAKQLGVALWDRTALQPLLFRLAGAYEQAQAEHRAMREDRVQAATETRAILVAALDDLLAALGAAENGKRAAGRRAVRAAIEQAAPAEAELARALLAWETLLDDWAAAFGERAARDGSLAIEAEVAALQEMGERAGHLKQAAQAGLTKLAALPSTGDAAYVAWRKAAGETLTARFEALRWRAATFDPTQWQDYAHAHDDDAAQRAARAATAASHAAARAEKARAQLG